MFFNNTHIHFMGISGIGMSGIAKILLQQGYKVSGCDASADKKHIQELTDLGCIIAPYHQHTICQDPSISVLVYTTSININHPEIILAQQKNITVVHRATMLAEIMRHKFGVAVAGSHGKTTTTSLLTHVLLETDQQPTFIIGGHLNTLKTNAALGNGNIVVAEADESDRSFLKLPKTWSIVTNIDLEHLETYTNLDDVKQTFIKFMNDLPFYGRNIICLDDPGIESVIPHLSHSYITYGQHPQAHLRIENIQLNADTSTFTLLDTQKNQDLGQFTTVIPGIHNVYNSAAVISFTLLLNIALPKIKQALATFQGVDRRFTLKGLWPEKETLVYDDYGHHPEEIKNTIAVARKKASKKLIFVFQPHRFTRTKHLWDDFISVLSNPMIDQIIITDIFPASETPIPGITSQRLVEAILSQKPDCNVWYYQLQDQGAAILAHLEQHCASGDLVLFQGAGKINQLAQKLPLVSPK